MAKIEDDPTCVCGHALREHDDEMPHYCLAIDVDDFNECPCMEFRYLKVPDERGTS